MMLKDLKAEALRLLSYANIENSFLEVRVILDHVGLSPVLQITSPSLEVDEKTAEEVLRMARMRAQHIPLSHITGHREFYGLDFITTADTLIPRADTETLVEVSLEAIKGIENPAVLDLCTGTGCVGLAIAANKECALTLADISDAALEVARRNRERLLAADYNVKIIKSDLFASIVGSYDLIATNPPYIARKWEADLSEEVKKEPSLALFDECEDGLGIIREIVKEAHHHLKSGGTLAIECDYRQTHSLSLFMEERGYRDVRITRDLAGLERVVSGRL